MFGRVLGQRPDHRPGAPAKHRRRQLKPWLETAASIRVASGACSPAPEISGSEHRRHGTCRPVEVLLEVEAGIGDADQLVGIAAVLWVDGKAGRPAREV